MSVDALHGLQREVDALGSQPVHVHPDILDRVHQALVAELEGLAGAGSERSRGA